MVDFNSENIVSAPPKVVKMLLLLEKAENFQAAKETYLIQKLQGSNPPLNYLKARLDNLISDWFGFLVRTQGAEVVESWLMVVSDKTSSFEDIYDIFKQVLVLMDKAKLTRIDIQTKDFTDIEGNNEEAGLD